MVTATPGRSRADDGVDHRAHHARGHAVHHDVDGAGAGHAT